MISCAKQSPRICSDNTIRWYEGDTFKIEFEVNLTDTNGRTLQVEENEEIYAEFYKDGKVIHTASVVGSNVLPFELTEETTLLFKRGVYFYDMFLKGEFKTTIVNGNKAVVE